MTTQSNKAKATYYVMIQNGEESFFDPGHDDYFGGLGSLTGWIDEKGRVIFSETRPKFCPFTGKKISFKTRSFDKSDEAEAE